MLMVNEEMIVFVIVSKYGDNNSDTSRALTSATNWEILNRFNHVATITAHRLNYTF